MICGGTALVERSLRSFRAIVDRIPEVFAPRELLVIGGDDNPASRARLPDFGNVRCHYHPEIDAAEASRLLATGSFAWLDYFHRPDVPTSVALKSTAFAAACAHGVIPVLPHRGSEISLEGDRLPGPYFIESNSAELPPVDDHARIANEFYDWYQRRASSDILVKGIVAALMASPSKSNRS